MIRTHRLSTTGALIVCLVGTRWSGTLFASEENLSSSETPSSESVVNSTSEMQAATAARSAAAVSARQQPATATDLSSGPLSSMGRSRFTLTNEVFMANAPVGPANAQVWHSTFNFIPIESSSLAQRGHYRGRRTKGNGAAAAIVLGAVASIAGAAILVYANRPECSTNQRADGCGYGTKVVGGAVLSGGIVGLVAGAVTWR
jgi:hypothetical protein